MLKYTILVTLGLVLGCASEPVAREQAVPAFVLSGNGRTFLGSATLTVQSDKFSRLSVDSSKSVGPDLDLNRIIGSLSGQKWRRDGNKIVVNVNFTEGFPDSSQGRFRLISSQIRHDPVQSGPGANVGGAGADKPNPTPGPVTSTAKQFYYEESELNLVVSASGQITGGVGEFSWTVIPQSAIVGGTVDWSKQFTISGSGPVELSCLRVAGVQLDPVEPSQEAVCAELFLQ